MLKLKGHSSDRLGDVIYAWKKIIAGYLLQCLQYGYISPVVRDIEKSYKHMAFYFTYVAAHSFMTNVNQSRTTPDKEHRPTTLQANGVEYENPKRCSKNSNELADSRVV